MYEAVVAKTVPIFPKAAKCPKSRFGDRAGGTLRVKQLRGKEGGKLGLKKGTAATERQSHVYFWDIVNAFLQLIFALIMRC